MAKRRHKGSVSKRNRRRRGDGVFDVFKKAFHVVNQIGKPFRGIAGKVFEKYVPGSAPFVGVGSDLFDKVLGNGIHPGFKRAAASIARREGVPIARAKAILATSSRRGSPAARRRNPRLKRVRGRGFSFDTPWNGQKLVSKIGWDGKAHMVPNNVVF